MATEALFVDRSGLREVRVHPVVIMSILEQYVRRDCEEDKPDRHVIGTLLGSYSAGVVEITNSFGVPLSEKGEGTEINMVAAAKTLALHRQLSPGESVVGWYSTCDEKAFVSDAIVLTQDFYMKETARAVYLGVDVSFKSPRVPLKAYYCPTSTLLLKCRMQQFQELPVSLTASDAERVGLSTLSLSLKSPSHTLPTDTEALLGSVSRLATLIDAAIAFVDAALASGSADPSVGRGIAAALSQVRRVTGAGHDAYLRTLQDAVQDALMIMHVSKVAVARVAVTDKIKQHAYASSR